MATISNAIKTIAVITMTVAGIGLFIGFRFSWSVSKPLWAGFGGMIVFLGLWIEDEAQKQHEKRHPRDLIDEEKRIKRLSRIGWYILMAGIAAEVLFAVVIATFDVRQAWASDPANKPLLTASASVRLQIQTPTNMDRATKYSAKIFLRSRDRNKFWPTVELECRDLEFLEIGPMTIFSGQFELSGGSRFGSLMGLQDINQPVWEFLSSLNSFDLILEASTPGHASPSDFIVQGGDAKLTVNSFLPVEFVIPDQIARRSAIIGENAATWSFGTPLETPFSPRK